MPDESVQPEPMPEMIAEGVRRLRRGEPVAFPTETVYGLGASALDEAAIARVFAIKGRPSTNPLIVHVSGPEMAARVVAEWTDDAGKLADAFWPGPLSLVLPKARAVPDLVTGGGPTVAVRMPRHPVALALLEAFGGPLVGPSANPSGSVSPTTAAHVRDSWATDELFVIDGGPCTLGIESTVLRLPPHGMPPHGSPPHFDPPRVLRPGAVSTDEISACLGCQVLGFEASSETEPGSPAASPGLLHAHYQPAAPVVVNPQGTIEGEAVIELPADAHRAAAMLYARLRDADAMSPVRIVVRVDPGVEGTNPLWEAIFDRLRRASAPNSGSS